MKRFIAGALCGFALVKGAECVAREVKTERIMKGWSLGVDFEGKGYACDDPVIYDEKKVIACTGGYIVKDYKDGKDTTGGKD